MEESQAQEAQPSIEQRISALLHAPKEESGGVETTEGEAPRAEAREAEIPQVEVTQAEVTQEETPEASDSVEEVEISDIGQLAEHHGYDVADLYNLTIPYTQNGERHEFSLGEIKDSLPEFRETVQMRTQAQETLARVQQHEQALAQEIQAHQQQMGTMVQALQQTMMSEMQAVDWAKLEQEDPGQWARMREQYRLKSEQLTAASNQAAQYFNQRAQQLQQLRAQEMQNVLQREQQALVRAIPEWRDTSTADSERMQLATYLRDSGYGNEEIEALADHRIVRDLRKAMLFDSLSKSGDVAAKKVVKLSKKIVKPGQRQTAVEESQQRDRQLVANHRKNPKSMDAAAARIRARFK